MAFVRMLGNLLKDNQFGPRIVPIVADEARTFGMANLFRQVGIYSSVANATRRRTSARCCPTAKHPTADSEEGISEGGAISSWTAAATSYSVHGFCDAAVLHLLLDVRLPAGGDLIWAAATSSRAASCSAPPPAAPRSAVRVCSIRTAPATCGRNSTQLQRPTTRRSPARWP